MQIELNDRNSKKPDILDMQNTLSKLNLTKVSRN